MKIDPRLKRIVAAQPYPLLFATISGAHVRKQSVHLTPALSPGRRGRSGLEVRGETVEQQMRVPPHPGPLPIGCGEGGVLEMDIVSHDVRKFFGLLLKKNGYVLEQLYSPLIVHTTPEHAELKKICRAKISSTSPNPLPGRGGEGIQTGVITKHHAHHYFGFAETQWKLFLKESPRRVKPLLYVYRVLLTGIHLMRSGEVQANLVTLNEEFRLPYIPDLVARKLAGPEQSTLSDVDISFHESEYQRLRGELQAAHEASQLPELPSDETRAALNDLLVRVRFGKRR
jgi:predicted nucleotidyltransferase